MICYIKPSKFQFILIFITQAKNFKEVFKLRRLIKL